MLSISWICMSSLCRGRANLLGIVPFLVYVLPEQAWYSISLVISWWVSMWFHIIDIVNWTGRNIGVKVTLPYAELITFAYIPRSVMTGSLLHVFLDLWSISLLSSIIIVLVYIPTNSALGYFFFSTASPAFVLYWFLNNDHTHCGEVKLHCVSYWYCPHG